MPNETLSFPPFPPLIWDKFSWVGEVNLPSWAGFQSRRGAYGSIDSANSSNGLFQMSIKTEGDKPGPITSEQVEAFRFLLDHEASVAESIFRAICSAYPEIREECADDLEEAGQIMPEIRRPEDLRPLIGLAQIHLLRVAAAGQGYVGFELGCIWDSEHGLGVMTHRDRVVEIGGADTSFLWWIADEDSRSAQ